VARDLAPALPQAEWPRPRLPYCSTTSGYIQASRLRLVIAHSALELEERNGLVELCFRGLTDPGAIEKKVQGTEFLGQIGWSSQLRVGALATSG
jgi:hypothetical protein